MKKNPNYSLYKIHDVCYLLPHGQGIADHSRGIQLNESAVFLWNSLDEYIGREELLQCFISHFEKDTDVAALTKDFDSFLFLLTSLGILTEDWKEPASADTPAVFLKIGPLTLCLLGDKQIIPKEFDNYIVSECGNPNLTISLINDYPAVNELGMLLIENEELSILEEEEAYRLYFPALKQIVTAFLSKDGEKACIYYKNTDMKELSTELFHTIRTLFLYMAKKHGCYALHSASILYQNKAWLFSGQSGKGKSTHTRIWEELFHTPVLNGDLNLISITDDGAVIYGMPWCGTSGITNNKTYPLGGILLLNQAEADCCQELTTDRKVLLTAQRLISPAWSITMLQDNLNFTSRLADYIDICRLHCTKENSAAYTSKKWIDDCNQKYLSKQG